MSCRQPAASHSAQQKPIVRHVVGTLVLHLGDLARLQALEQPARVLAIEVRIDRLDAEEEPIAEIGRAHV